MKPKPDEKEAALFREAIRGVKPLRHTPRVVAVAPKPPARARFTRAGAPLLLEPHPHGADEEPALSAGDPTHFARPGISGTVLRKLRRGEYRVQAELDLHGLTAAAAEIALREFLTQALARKVSCLRIVHGKGLRSGLRGPVLRQLVNSVLRRIARVLAFASARQGDGGTGAVYVLLDATGHASSASTTTD